MRNYIMYSEEAVKKVCAKSKKIVIVADYREINYEDDNDVAIVKLAEELDIEFYPVVGSFSANVKKVINYFYKDYKIFVEGSLLS